MQDEPNALLEAASAVAAGAQMLFDVDDECSHRLVGFFVPARLLTALTRAVADTSAATRANRPTP